MITLTASQHRISSAIQGGNPQSSFIDSGPGRLGLAACLYTADQGQPPPVRGRIARGLVGRDGRTEDGRWWWSLAPVPATVGSSSAACSPMEMEASAPPDATQRFLPARARHGGGRRQLLPSAASSSRIAV
ncbi:hypothetical protein GQ55_4G036400 [Panicum hallii var. hallii]|uniref:Uncharacterized protein n=1 Tax=Panicum hallii var. hallii TaxID=1504633 RepID=A0A2T7DUX7_9POAL|nr:hypothetical protein GQ55_4G036400 [Panicum hallii var. hallii]